MYRMSWVTTASRVALMAPNVEVGADVHADLWFGAAEGKEDGEGQQFPG